jgi:cyclase
MVKKRLIACLLIRDGLLVQSICFKKYLPIGHPKFQLENISRWDVDEIILLDISATKNKTLIDIGNLKELSKNCFVPLSVGGGIKSIYDVKRIIQNGADKVVINSHAFSNPELISKSANEFGSQCIIVSIDCKKEHDGRYQVYKESGSMATGLSPIDWALKAEKLGAGELLINSIDRDGSKEGYDIDLINEISNKTKINVIACGGVGKFSDFALGILKGNATAVAAGNIFHYIEHSTILAKAHMLKSNIDVRLDSEARYEGRDFDELGRLNPLSEEILSNIQFVKRHKGLI